MKHPRRLTAPFRWLGSVFSLRRIAFVAASFATLVAGFYIVENWRGERAWSAAQAGLRAAGEPLSLQEYLPKTPPDDQNFLMNPVFVRRFGIGEGRPTLRDPWEWVPGRTGPRTGDDSSFNYDAFGSLNGSHANDLAGLAACLPAAFMPTAPVTETSAAEAILRWSDQWKDDFDALARAARARPQSHLPFFMSEDHRLEHWQVMEGWLDGAWVLRLRCLAQVAARDQASALDSVVILLRMAEAPTAEPVFVLSVVLAHAVHSQALLPLHEGLRHHLWDETQLSEIDRALARLDLRGAFSRSWRGDRLYFQHVLDVGAAADRKHMGDAFRTEAMIATFCPRGWLRQNQARAVDWQLRQQSRLRHPPFARPPENYPNEDDWFSPYAYLLRIMIHGIQGVERGVDEMEARSNLARVALALERHRLAHDAWPESLEAMKPPPAAEQIQDPYSGQPFQYELSTGSPRLWSVGPNRRDDGGNPESDDIVWAYPAP